MIPQLLDWNVIGVISSIEKAGNTGYTIKNQMNGKKQGRKTIQTYLNRN